MTRQLIDNDILWILSSGYNSITSTIVGTIVSFGIASILYYFKKTFTRSKRRSFLGLPVPPNRHWLMGHILALGGDFRKAQHEVMVKHANSDGQTCFYMGNSPCISVLNWKDARLVLHSEFERKQFGMFHHHISQVIGPKSIIMLHGREWRKHRSVTKKTFGRPMAMEKLHETIPIVTNTLIHAIKQKHLTSSSSDNGHDQSVVMHIHRLTKMIALDIFGKAALSYEFGCCEQLKLSELALAFDYLNSTLSSRLHRPLHPFRYFYSIPTPENVAYAKKRSSVRSFLASVVAERQSDPTAHNDLISFVLQAAGRGGDSEHEEEKKEDDIREVSSVERSSFRGADVMDKQSLNKDETWIDLLMSLLFAGYDTTSITLAYALYLVSTNPEVEQQCLEEIRLSSLCKDPSTWSEDELVYCEAIILETLRLFPPGTVVQRHLQKAMKLSTGLKVPKGTCIYVPIWCIQHDEETFPQANEFRPDRWVRRKSMNEEGTINTSSPFIQRYSEEEEMDYSDAESLSFSSSSLSLSSSSSSYIPAGNRKALLAFSGGARSCAGRRFAMKEAIGVFAHLMKEFKFSPIDGYEMIPVRNGLVQTPKDGLPMNIRLRQ